MHSLRQHGLWTALTLPLAFCLIPPAPAQAHPHAASTHTIAPPMSPSDLAALHAALDLYDAGNLPQAEPALITLATKYPQNFEATEALGSLYAESAQPEKALPYLERATRLSPAQPLAHANLGATYLKLGKLPEARRELQKAAGLDPANPATQSNLGQALLALGDPTAAAHAYTIALDKSPGDPAITYNLALALFQAGAPAAAQKASDLLENLPPAARTPETDSLAADAAERSGLFERALAHYQAAAHAAPTDANLYALVTELLRHWNWAETAHVAAVAQQQYPASQHFKLAAGIAFYADNHYPEAVEVFSQLLAAEPNNPTFADLLGRSCSLLPEGQNPGCAAMYTFAEQHPGNAITTTYAAVALLHGPQSGQQLDRAQTLLNSAIAADPNYAEAYLQLGMLHQTRQNWAASAQALERSIALRPTNPEAHYRLSRAYSHLGRRAEAADQVALNQTYAQQAKDTLNARMQEVMKFALDPK